MWNSKKRQRRCAKTLINLSATISNSSESDTSSTINDHLSSGLCTVDQTDRSANTVDVVE